MWVSSGIICCLRSLDVMSSSFRVFASALRLLVDAVCGTYVGPTASSATGRSFDGYRHCAVVLWVRWAGAPIARLCYRRGGPFFELWPAGPPQRLIKYTLKG